MDKLTHVMDKLTHVFQTVDIQLSTPCRVLYGTRM